MCVGNRKYWIISHLTNEMYEEHEDSVFQDILSNISGCTMTFFIKVSRVDLSRVE